MEKTGMVHDLPTAIKQGTGMKSIESADPYSRPSLLKRAATPVLHVMHRVLPRPVYDALYEPMFATYQAMLRAAYARRLQRVRRSGDKQKVQQMTRVQEVMKYSLISAPGLEHTHDLAQELVDREVDGAFIECGVARGGCAALIARVAADEGRNRQCWFFDSYEGLPDPTEQDFEEGKTGRHIRPLPKGSCLGTIEQVSQLLFEHMNLPREHVHLVKGWFQETLPIEKHKIGPIALLRIDGDWYDSTLCVLEQLYDSVAEGGYVLVDDYHSCFGARKATDEFMAARRVQAELIPDGRGGASFRKPCSSDASVRAA